MKCSKSPGCRGFAPDPTGELTALPHARLLVGRKYPLPKPLGPLSLAFGPSGLAISADRHNVVDGFAPMVRNVINILIFHHFVTIFIHHICRHRYKKIN